MLEIGKMTGFFASQHFFQWENLKIMSMCPLFQNPGYATGNHKVHDAGPRKCPK